MSGEQSNGKRIREVRKALGLTQEALAKFAQCDLKTLRRAENSGSVNASTLHRISLALNVDFRELTQKPLQSSGERANGERANTGTVWSFYEVFNLGDALALTDFFHEDATLELPSTALNPDDEVVLGKARIQRRWECAFAESQSEKLSLNNVRIEAAGDYVFARAICIRIRRLADSQHFRASFAQDFLLTNGKIHQLTIIQNCIPI